MPLERGRRATDATLAAYRTVRTLGCKVCYMQLASNQKVLQDLAMRR